MKKLSGILILIMLLILTGCTNQKVTKVSYTYKGENDLWTAEYKVNGTKTITEKKDKSEYNSDYNNSLIVTYKKDVSELASMKSLEISYESSATGGKSNQSFDDNTPKQKTYTIKTSSTGSAIEREDEIIKVDINIDGKIQTIELKNAK
ncbi:hypothetical protein [Clostridium sp. 'White wine YQ']|uniref:hypothetical protein n=1 Tax=Clostridium sp. 'White wine YQ' TaxID=3027474 RepID=UPI0023656699|nr:hypothetical protein [Clostridium sp. 'White wine YQ']MDD7796067.1 hypothetical protein [Clostridium sp. 'White wine YQ']